MNIRIALLIGIGVLFCINVQAEEPTTAMRDKPGLVSCFKSVKKPNLKSYETDECKLAVAFYLKAIGEKPAVAENYILLGRCYGFMLQFEEAIKYADKAIALDPKDWTPHMDKAMDYVALRRFKDAQPEFRKALDILNAQGGKLKDIQIVEEMMQRYDR